MKKFTKGLSTILMIFGIAFILLIITSIIILFSNNDESEIFYYETYYYINVTANNKPYTCNLIKNEKSSIFEFLGAEENDIIDIDVVNEFYYPIQCERLKPNSIRIINNSTLDKYVYVVRYFNSEGVLFQEAGPYYISNHE